jgi:hypothetical protein
MISILKNQRKDVCWWCGNTANSREHRHKKSDLKRIFGGDKKFDAVICRDDETIYLQGPDSHKAKFEKSLCHNCNTARSQKFDLAYDQFITYIINNQDKIIRTGKFDWEDIFGENYIENKMNVLRYYTKHLCCKLSSNNITINKSIIDFLNFKTPIQYLYIKFEINLDLMKFLEFMRKEHGDIGNLYAGPVTVQENKKEGLEWVYTFYTYKYFQIKFIYSDDIREEFFSGYNHYNVCKITPVRSYYNVHPEKFKDCTLEEFLSEYTKKTKKNYGVNNQIDDLFSSNPFIKFATN